jgi:hypothetical protein
MEALTTVLLGFPTVIYTVMLGVCLLYWLFIVIGAVDLDFLGGSDGALEGAAKGVAEGAIKGVMEGAFKGVAEGAIKGVAEGAIKGVSEGAADAVGRGDGHGLDADTSPAGIFSWLRLRSAPVTVTLTVFTIFGFLTSALAVQALERPGTLLGLGVLVASAVASLLLTSVAVRPLAPIFATNLAKGHRDLVGRVCVVSTGRVDTRFGQATLEDGGAGLILQVRSDANELRRGDRVLIIGWNAEREGFEVEPMEPLEGTNQRIAAPGAKAAEVAGAADTEGVAAEVAAPAAGSSVRRRHR